MPEVSLSHSALSILPQTYPLGRCPIFFRIHLSFWPLRYPASSCGFQNLGRAFTFAILVFSADFSHCIHSAPEEGTPNSAAAAVHAQPGCFFLSHALFLMGQLLNSSVILSLNQPSILRHFCYSVSAHLQNWYHRWKGFHPSQHTGKVPHACSTIPANFWKALNVLLG